MLIKYDGICGCCCWMQTAGVLRARCGKRDCVAGQHAAASSWLATMYRLCKHQSSAFHTHVMDLSNNQLYSLTLQHFAKSRLVKKVNGIFTLINTHSIIQYRLIITLSLTHCQVQVSQESQWYIHLNKHTFYNTV